MVDDGAAFVGSDGRELGTRGEDQRAIDDGGAAFGIEERNEGFADAEFGDGLFDVDVWILAEGFGGGANCFLIARGEGAEGVLDAIAELAENGIGNVERVLGDEIDADAFGTNEADDLLDFLEERGRGFVEEQMRFIEKENEFWFGRIADFGKVFEEFGNEPEEEGGVDFG